VPVQRFRNVDEMNRAPVIARGGDDFERFLRQCRRYRAIAQPLYPRGVFKFRNVEQAQAARARHRAAGGDAQESPAGREGV
jgi:hypothetical protein